MSLKVLRPGVLATVQDLGRPGLQHLGIAPGGAMDPISHRIANALVGNRAHAATLEMALLGPELQLGCDALIALCGARFAAAIDGVPLPQSRPVLLRAGARLRVGRATQGGFGYLAVAGGLHVDPVLGSRSTHLAGGFGGWQGRSLARDAELPFATDAEALARARFAHLTARHRSVTLARCETVRWLAPGFTLPEHDESAIRTVEGVHAALFDETAPEVFYGERWRIATHSNRMGYRLLGPRLALVRPIDILSQPTCLGAVQVPPTGQPIVLMADHQTTGGYPRIAEVIAADVPRLAQSTPGATVRFAHVSLTEADAAREALWTLVDQLVERILWEFGDEGD
jgi:antagonist of KipI